MVTGSKRFVRNMTSYHNNSPLTQLTIVHNSEECKTNEDMHVII